MKTFGNKFASLLFCLSLAACARPEWAPDSSLGSNPLPQNKVSTSECRQQFKSGLCLNWAWIKFQTESDTGIIELQLQNLGEPIDTDLKLNLVLWMPEMGHGSAPTKIKRTGVGTYRIENIYFTMPGLWQLRFQLKNNNQVVEEVIEDIRF